MNDEKMLDKIKQSANSCEVPTSLKPESITDKLSDKKATSTTKRIYQIGGLAAAAFALVIGISALNGPQMSMNEAPMWSASEEVPEMSADSEVAEATNEDFSNIFKQAKDYKDVLDAMDDYEETMRKEMESYARSSGDEEVSFDVVEEAVAEAPSAESASADTGGGTSDYSKTNLQVEGVDESDIIKTDGEYIYIVRNNREIRIVKVNGADMEEVTTVKVDSADDDVSVSEIYLDGDKLSVIAHGYGNELRKVDEDTFFMDTRSVTRVYTYDISNRQSPKLLGRVSQDGSYSTSRKVGDYIYLFTSFYPKYLGSMENNARDNGHIDMVPYINEEMIEPANIYLPIQPQTTSYMVMSSVNLKKPSEIVDRKAVLEDASDFYVTTGSIYVRKENWGGRTTSTSIAKFSFKDGIIKGESAGVVPGRITDTFAINEYNNTLRVLTTAHDGGWETEENIVSVFDERMNAIGQIRGIAKGETIYSARFFGELGYFVTFRNVDPLFAVDFSDPHNPEILGELKITGYSEYLHFYGKDRLLGIGWEVDEHTGVRQGLKLSMFDISDPTKLDEINKIVIQNVDAFQGEYDYKALTISPEKNIIGLATTWWGGDTSAYNYLVFSYEEGQGFKSQLAYAFAQDNYIIEHEFSRGIYIDNIFYVIASDKIYAFDMEQGYHKVGEL